MAQGAADHPGAVDHLDGGEAGGREGGDTADDLDGEALAAEVGGGAAVQVDDLARAPFPGRG